MSALLTFESQVFEAQPDFLSDLGQPSLGKLAPVIEAAVLGMEKRDWVSVGRRAQVVACLRGANPVNIGNGYNNYKVAPAIGNPADRAIQAVGLAIGSARPVLCLLGNAALADGRIFEAVQLAATSQAPVIYVIMERDLSEAPLASSTSVVLQTVATQLGVTVANATADDIGSQVSTARSAGTPHLICVSV